MSYEQALEVLDYRQTNPISHLEGSRPAYSALRQILELHKPEHLTSTSAPECYVCADGLEGPPGYESVAHVPWPCPTARLILEAVLP